MPFSAWLTLIIVAGVLFGGLAWSIKIAMRGNGDKKK